MTVFLIIGGIGVVLLLVSVILGDVLDGAFEGIGGDLFSGAALAGFLGAFGFVGALTFGGTNSIWIASAVGVGAGLIIGALVGWVSLKLKQGGDESNVNTATLTGREAVVSTAIPAEGYGELSITVSGHITKLNARAATPIAAGTAVTVTAVLSATSVMVEPKLQ